MKSQSFDGLPARCFSVGSRRELGKGTLAAALAALSRGPERAVAGHHRKTRKRKCGAPGRRRLCAGRCGPQRLCGKAVDCGVCPCATAADCLARGTGDRCCAGQCVTGLCCGSADCANPTPACLGNACAPCTASAQCPAAQVCDLGGICCQPEGTPCTDFRPCCSQTCDNLVNGGTCAPCRGRACNATKPCCGGETCTGGYCGGCRDRATACTSSTQCCTSNCTNGACLSAMGGRCVRDVDCRACYLSHTCTNACVGGVCTV